MNETSQLLQVIVDSARKLTGADSSTLFLRDAQSKRFVVASRAAEQLTPLLSMPRATGGLSSHIIASGEAVLIRDTAADPRVRPEVIQGGIQSLAGAPINIGEDRVGVLYINGLSKDQFTKDHLALLKTLAAQASVTRDWAQLLLDLKDQIANATSHLAHLDSLVEEVCNEIKNQLGFEFVAVQLIRPEENTIETLRGIGIARDWESRAKHYLETNPDLQDIQAAIALADPRRVEIIVGWDKRLDRWIFETYRHHDFVRVFAPLVLVRTQRGQVLPNGVQFLRWGKPNHVINPVGEPTGVQTVIPMGLPAPTAEDDELILDVIGTVEAGFRDHRRHNVGVEEAIAVTELATRRAVDIRRTLLPYVLEAIAERASKVVHADAASLHFPYRPRENRFVYEVYSGDLSKRYLQKCPPRPEGLGWAAIKAREPKIVPDGSVGHNAHSLAELNKPSYDEGLRAIAAIPLFVDNEEGILYICFRREHWFTEAEIAWLEPFVTWAQGAVRQASRYTQLRDRLRQLGILSAVADSLVSTPKESDVLTHFAWNTLRILVADVVTIYEYSEADDLFETPPVIAGRLIAQRTMQETIRPYDVPEMFVQNDEISFYADRSSDDPLLVESRSRRPEERGPSFVAREGIESSARVKLMVGDETLGVMFINYRRPHNFSEEEKTIVATLASSAAFVVKNRRIMEALRSVDSDIINTPDLRQILDLIAERAAQITDAKFGAVRTFDLLTQDLKTEAVFPRRGSEQFDAGWSNLSQVHGILGWVTDKHTPALVNDVARDARYQSAPFLTVSELCVPLLAIQGRLLGVLHVADPRIGAFHWIDQRMLEALANQAVIAIQNAENVKHLVAAKSTATLGDLAGQLAHHTMHNDATAIVAHAKDIQVVVGPTSKAHELAREIESIAAQLVQSATKLKSCVLEPKSQPVNIHQTILNALEQFSIPICIEQKFELAPNPKTSDRGLHGVVLGRSAVSAKFLRAVPPGIGTQFRLWLAACVASLSALSLAGTHDVGASGLRLHARATRQRRSTASTRKNTDCHGFQDSSRYTMRRPVRTIWHGSAMK